MPKKNDTVQTENLDGLLQRIRQEGSERANQEAEQILAAARQRAADIVKKAESEAKRIVQEGESRVTQLAEAGRKAQEQAARDLVLAVRSELIAMLDRLVERAGREVLTGEALQKLILNASADWVGGDSRKNIEIQLNEKDRARLADGFLSRLKEELQAGVELKAHPGIQAGFRVGSRGGAMFYDFTAPALAEALAALLRPQFAKVFDTIREEGKGE
jgi:V/A-type H+-transporting ATPase subunit E